MKRQSGTPSGTGVSVPEMAPKYWIYEAGASCSFANNLNRFYRASVLLLQKEVQR